jgi:hypothetical protein
MRCWEWWRYRERQEYGVLIEARKDPDEPDTSMFGRLPRPA